MNGRQTLVFLRPYIKHLRVPFQLSLSPLFLWGYFLASLDITPALFTGFASFHLFLYTGITAFNSAYDKDEGPVGGMLHPPAAPPRLLEFSLLVQCIGAAPAACVNSTFFVLYLVIALLGAAYSHPRWRWKASPTASLLTVWFGQGVCGCLAGWAAAQGSLLHVGSVCGIGAALSAAFTTLGLYPLTQVYQTAEDSRRGDRTLAIALGPTGALQFGFVSLVIAGVLAAGIMVWTARPFDALLVGAGYIFMLWQVFRFARAFSQGRHSVTSAFHTAMRLNSSASIGFLIFIVLHFAHWL